MKQKSIFLFLVLLLTLAAYGQQKLHLNLSNSCSHDGEAFDKITYSWASSDEANDIIERICNVVGLQARFQIKTASVPNATAYIKNNQRLILYSESFIQNLNQSTGDGWAGTSILAHEIGHHLNNHTLEEDGSRPEIELEADEFSGFVLARMGATLVQTQASLQSVSINGNDTHPARRARLEAVAVGWRRGGGGRNNPIIGNTIIDRDGDGIPDVDDACPLVFGNRQTRGCPDADEDGIPDQNDDCPYEAGTTALNGCPERAPEDSDGDGIPDVSDKCRTTRGLARFQGCPDTDGDGIPDHADDCPRQKGLAMNKGCPKELVLSENTPTTAHDGLVFVQGGTFQMGSNKYDDEKPIHRVTVPDFYIGKYEVTQKQWRDVMGSDPEELYNTGCDNCPVERVSWNDIQTFLTKLNQQTGNTDSYRYRLPSEAEWEYAARGGRQSKGYKYAGSNNLKEVAWYRDNSYDLGSKHKNYGTNPVGQKKANELGIYDMSGNVWEWCEDDWHDSYNNAPKNGSAWIDRPRASKRVNGGGGWRSFAGYCRVADRYNWDPDGRDDGIGFRLAHSSK